jgi:hypothetical protein
VAYGVRPLHRPGRWRPAGRSRRSGVRGPGEEPKKRRPKGTPFFWLPRRMDTRNKFLNMLSENLCIKSPRAFLRMAEARSLGELKTHNGALR